MHRRLSARVALVAVAVVLLGGCQAIVDAVDSASVNDRDDLRDDLVATGLARAEADCMLTELDRQLSDLDGAIEASGGSRGDFEAENTVAYRAALGSCVDFADMGGTDLAEFRRGFIEGMVQDPTLETDEEQAACVYDELLDRGIKPQAMVDDQDTAFLDELPGAMEACGVATPELGDLSEEELRRAFVIGFAAGGGVTQAEAECVYDGMVAEGVPPIDFAGDVLTPQAEQVLPDVLAACDVQL